MNALGLASASLFVALLAHAALLRVFPLRMALLSLACCIMAAMFAISAIALAVYPSFTMMDLAVGALLTGSLGVAYALLFIGISYDSPTLALVNAIADYGASGMPVDDIEQFVARHPFVSSRLSALTRAGMLIPNGESWRLRGEVGPLVYFGEAYRRLCTRQTTVG
jgi:hypothetical protein